MHAATATLHAPAVEPGVFTSELAVHERILRRALGACGPAAALDCVASEVWPYLSHRWAWVAQAEGGAGEARLMAAWPDGDQGLALPGALPFSPRLAGGSPGSHTRVHLGVPGSSDPYDRALWNLGVSGHVTFSLGAGNGGGRLVTFACSGPPGFTSGQIAAARRLSCSVGAALATGDDADTLPSAVTWAGMDPVEVVDYVCGATAHDVRNILASIMGTLELQRETGTSASDALYDAVRARIMEGVAMADAMRKRVSRGSGQDAQPLDIAQVAGHVVHVTRPVVVSLNARNGPVIECTGDPSPAEAHPRELRRAVCALLFNAVHAAGPGGWVRMHTSVDGRWARLEVTDDGPGMPREVCRRAREPFFTTRAGEHLGLGLTIADGVARRYGGNVVLRSAPGEGTTATLRLPALNEA